MVNPCSAARAILLCLALAAAGCAARGPHPAVAVPEGESLDALAAPPLSPAELSAFRDIPERVISSGGRTWVIQPRSVLGLNGTLVEYHFGEEEGLLGPILSLDYDDRTLWLGTPRGVNQLDTEFLTNISYETFGDSPDTYARFLAHDERGDLWVVTRQAVVWLNPVSRASRSFAFRNFTYSDLREVLFDGMRIWFATQEGLRRFSCEWKAWDPVPGSRDLAKRGILHLERDRGQRLWAMSDSGLYLYEPQFDTWQYVGR